MARSPLTGASGALAPHGLVIVEGIMGSGKSTTMRFIAKSLEDRNRRAQPIHERTDPHPVRATDELEHWYQPWLDATPAQLADRAVAKWTAFVQTVQAGDVVPVMDGQLFHGDLTHLLLMEAKEEEIFDYVQTVARVTTPLDPLVVYFRQDDVDKAIRAICAERGDEWVTYQVAWKLAAPYCVRRKFTGLEGLVDLYRNYRRLTDKLFDALPVDKIVIENSEGNWPVYQRRILTALGLAENS